MKHTFKLLPLLSLTACGLPPIVAIPASLIAAPTVDRMTNAALGGNPSYTITTQTAIARQNGSKAAANLCVYDVGVSWYDAAYFSQDSWKVFSERKADHCERWRLHETGELAKIKGEPAATHEAPMIDDNKRRGVIR